MGQTCNFSRKMDQAKKSRGGEELSYLNGVGVVSIIAVEVAASDQSAFRHCTTLKTILPQYQPGKHSAVFA